MSKIEEVKSVLEKRQVYNTVLRDIIREMDIQSLAEELCQLFEPKSDKDGLLSDEERQESIK